MRTHDVLDVVAWVDEAHSSVGAYLLCVAVDHKQTDFVLERRDQRRQLVVLALLDTGVVHLYDAISVKQSRALGWRSRGHLCA